MRDVRIHIQNMTVNLPGKREAEAVPVYSRRPLVTIPIVSLPVEMYPGDGPAAEVPVYVEPSLEVPTAPAIILPPARITFRDAGEHYLKLYPQKLSIAQETVWLEELYPFIGDLPLNQIYDAKLQPFIAAQREKPLKGGKIGVKSATVNLKLGLVRHILLLAARSWRDDDGQTWLQSSPLITMVEGGDAREPRQLTWQEQRDHLHKLPEHLHRMALFDLQCGVRDEVLCTLNWKWEVIVPDVDIMTFIVPPDSVKGRKGKKTSRVLVCNSVARNIVESVRGQHPENVFVYRHGKREPRPVQTANNTAWQKWRAACGLGDLHVHDLRHTVGMRLREAGIAEDTRSDVLWHSRKSMTGWYSAAQVLEVHGALEKITSPAHAVNKSLASIAAERGRG